MYYFFELMLCFYVVVLFASCAILIRNSFLYTSGELFLKSLLIIFLPIIGGLIVLYQIGRFYKENKGSGDINSDAQWYAFWEYHGASNSNNSSSDYGSFDGGNSSGGSD